ncbi:anthranilate phosphoribosyltransferase [Bacillota bacterium LX-D]|nr:anthranilate phosphoribosyltransferase [Bacillota bacterium LX-D]
MLNEALKKILGKEDLTETEAMQVMDAIMNGEATPAQIGGLLTALCMKGENISEITGFAKSMRSKAKKVQMDSYAIDTCGTGGDGGKTFNISTIVALVAAAGGVKVAKHGNKAVSSKSGSADVLEALGVRINLDPSAAERCIKEIGIGFLFAPHYHTAMKNVVGPRRELGIKTVFNLLGPLVNPAFVQGQVLGVYDQNLIGVIAEVLNNLGIEKAMVVHGLDGLDEITITTKTVVSEVSNGEIINYTIDPEEYGFSYGTLDAIAGQDAAFNAQIISRVLAGQKGPARDIVLLNSGAALYVGKVAEDLHEGIRQAEELIDSGAALDKLNEFIEYSQEIAL